MREIHRCFPPEQRRRGSSSPSPNRGNIEVSTTSNRTAKILLLALMPPALKGLLPKQKKECVPGASGNWDVTCPGLPVSEAATSLHPREDKWGVSSASKRCMNMWTKRQGVNVTTLLIRHQRYVEQTANDDVIRCHGESSDIPLPYRVQTSSAQSLSLLDTQGLTLTHAIF